MKAFLDKLKEGWGKVCAFFKNLFKKETRKKIKKWCLENRRYCYAAILVLVLIIVLVSCTAINGKKKSQKSLSALLADFEIDTEYETDAFADVNEVVTNYLTAYVAADFDALDAVATPVSDKEKSYISTVANYMETFSDLKCYTLKGLTEDSFIVLAGYEIKFNGIDTTAPSLTLLYVEKNDEGNYYVNNLYCEYNWEHQENEIAPEVAAVIWMAKGTDAVTKLVNEQSTAYYEAVASDESLYILTNSTLPKDLYEWAKKNIESTEDSTEASTEVSTEETTEATTEQTPEAQAPEVKVKVTVKKVNVRASASKSGKKLGEATKDSEYTKLGEENEFTKIDYNGTTGYIASDYVEVVQ